MQPLLPSVPLTHHTKADPEARGRRDADHHPLLEPRIRLQWPRPWTQSRAGPANRWASSGAQLLPQLTEQESPMREANPYLCHRRGSGSPGQPSTALSPVAQPGSPNNSGGWGLPFPAPEKQQRPGGHGCGSHGGRGSSISPRGSQAANPT